MPKQAHFKRDYLEQLEGGKSKRYPGGWRGAVSDELFAAADQAGALRSSAVEPVQAGAAVDGDISKMSRDDLDAKLIEANLDPADYKKKSDVIAALSKE